MAPVLAEIGQYRADRLLNGARTTADGLAEHAVGHQAGAYWRSPNDACSGRGSRSGGTDLARKRGLADLRSG